MCTRARALHAGTRNTIFGVKKYSRVSGSRTQFSRVSTFTFTPELTRDTRPTPRRTRRDRESGLRRLSGGHRSPERRGVGLLSPRSRAALRFGFCSNSYLYVTGALYIRFILDLYYTHTTYVRSPRVRTNSMALGVRLAACSVSLVRPRTRAGNEVRSSYGALASTTPRVCLDGQMGHSQRRWAGNRQLWVGTRAPR